MRIEIKDVATKKVIKELNPSSKLPIVIPQRKDELLIGGKLYKVYRSGFNYDHIERQMGQDVNILLITIWVDELNL